MTAYGMPRGGGFSLIEALIALLLTSILAIVFMRMMGVSLSRTQESRTRAYAMHQMQSLAASISANPSFWVTKAAAPVTITVPLPAGGADCGTRPCTPAELARHDMALWASGLAARLSKPSGSASCAQTNDVTVCRIELSWRERGDPLGATSSHVMRFVP